MVTTGCGVNFIAHFYWMACTRHPDVTNRWAMFWICFYRRICLSQNPGNRRSCFCWIIFHFDLYMNPSEEFVDFDGLDRPLKLWIYYNSYDVQPEIFFPEKPDKDDLDNFYPDAFFTSSLLALLSF